MTAATPGQANYEAAIAKAGTQGSEGVVFPTWAGLKPWQRERYEAGAQAAREHRVTEPHFPPEDAASAEETAYEAFTARRGGQRIAWEALSPEEHADWRAVVRSLAARRAAEDPRTAGVRP
jgi:hypothetical protein